MPVVTPNSLVCLSFCCTPVTKCRISNPTSLTCRKFSITKVKKSPVPRGFWKDHSNQRKIFDDLGRKIGIQNLDDWYQTLSQRVFEENGARNLLNVHKGSPISALLTAYPEHIWIPWKFKIAPQGFWKSKENQRTYFDWLAKQLEITRLDDWYDKLSQKTLIENGARRLLFIYKGSPIAALMAAYPEHNWVPWKFRSAPQGFWKDVQNHRKFFDDLGVTLGIQSLDDWYEKLSAQVICNYGGYGLLHKHKDSPIAALMVAYPEHKWIPWKFNTVPLGYWQSADNVKQYLAYLSEKLSIQTLDDWYRVDHILLQHFGAYQVIARYNGLYQLLKDHYPHHPWDPQKFKLTPKKAQRWLIVTLKKIFPNEEVLEDYAHPKVVYPTSNRSVQLDAFIPSKSLAFEYQGKQHYQEVQLYGPSRIVQKRDQEKRLLCAANNIKLIEVPYWWNRTQDSLQSMIDQSLNLCLAS